MVLYGDLLNNTSFSQKLDYIFGTFYDAQDQVIADEENTFDYWPINIVPPGGLIPFELTVEDIQSVANFDLKVESEPSDETLRQDFELSDLDQSNMGSHYCVTGKLRNQGGALQYSLTIVLVLYDDQDKVVNFGDYAERSPAAVVDDQALDFEVCADALDQSIARHELRAWGQ